MTDRSLREAWLALRLNLREAARDHAESHSGRVSAVPPDPSEPEKIAPIVGALEGELGRLAGQGEASPVLRTVKRLLAPNEHEKARRRLVASYQAYRIAWEKEHRASPAG